MQDLAREIRNTFTYGKDIAAGTPPDARERIIRYL
jgi:hypothetical protein